MITTNLVFLGGGNMAEAIFAGLVNNPQFQIEVIQRNTEKAKLLIQKYPTIKVHQKLERKLNANEILFLAIKPQQAKEACLAINQYTTQCLIISVMAGLSIDSISGWTNNRQIIRTMPNTPSSVAKGITAWFANSPVIQEQQQLCETIFSKIGITYQAKNESEIDKIVPISSSSIAFVYYFMEGLIENAVNEFGFSKEQATALVKQVISGSSALLDANPDISITEQRARVTSKKGATEQGVIAFENENLHQIIKLAMQNCYKRTLEMSHEFN